MGLFNMMTSLGSFANKDCIFLAQHDTSQAGIPDTRECRVGSPPQSITPQASSYKGVPSDKIELNGHADYSSAVTSFDVVYQRSDGHTTINGR